ncbi:uncharacterized protein MONBRDRAFT_38177 [Monosiga brevicollis MX1]|uniref:Protein FAM136A n=1 Tax=Monosiga brevicollis TaxID=81824 RepID=A9V645_MONBE|nr:uncharacterized protein MONBRDRAFT_38177 [Monosiga brevicollis MX1]EDQ86924.1 predicted protein [Monosiga brevicollis MX1]|eukprot:XP_001748163.1 hypothetical protein [Monosiga brevicollis MX1]
MANVPEVQQLEQSVNDAVEKLEVQSREVMRKEFECSARCASNTSLKTADYHQCLTSCGQGTQAVAVTIQNELNSLQNQFITCINSCANAGNQAECQAQCAKDSMTTIPAFVQRVQAVISKYN